MRTDMGKLQGEYELRHNADRGPLCSCSSSTGPRSSFIPDALRWLHVRRAPVRPDAPGARRVAAAGPAGIRRRRALPARRRRPQPGPAAGGGRRTRRGTRRRRRHHGGGRRGGRCRQGHRLPPLRRPHRPAHGAARPRREEAPGRLPRRPPPLGPGAPRPSGCAPSAAPPCTAPWRTSSSSSRPNRTRAAASPSRPTGCGTTTSPCCCARRPRTPTASCSPTRCWPSSTPALVHHLIHQCGMPRQRLEDAWTDLVDRVTGTTA